MDPPELNWDSPQVSQAAKILEEEWGNIASGSAIYTKIAALWRL
jgi:hypothetical protein